jgi:hypothetical protein
MQKLALPAAITSASTPLAKYIVARCSEKE